MVRIDLKKPNGTLISSIDMPESVNEVTLSQFIDYQPAFDAWQKWLEENKTRNFNSPKYRKEELQHLCACVSAFIGQDASGIPIGQVVDKMSLSSGETTLNKLHAMIHFAISQYHGGAFDKDYWFIYRGVKYRLPEIARDAITAQERITDVSTAQAVEVLDRWRVYQDSFKGKSPDPNYTFTMILQLIATFAKSDGDKLPKNDSDIERWISERVVYFKDVDMQVGLDVLNFFFAGTSPAQTIQRLLFSSNHRRNRQGINTRSRRGAGRG